MEAAVGTGPVRSGFETTEDWSGLVPVRSRHRSPVRSGAGLVKFSALVHALLRLNPSRVGGATN